MLRKNWTGTAPWRMLALGLLVPLLGPGRCGPSEEEFTCTEVVGFSQTRQWYIDSDFEMVVEDAAWQLRAPSGATIVRWSDPDYAGWSDPPYSYCTEGDTLQPDRVLLTISGDFGDDVPAWSEAIEETVHVIAEERYPDVKEIVLQAVVGGPQGHDEPPCPWGDGAVRASYQHPYIFEAIANVVDRAAQEGRDVIAGADPHVSDCAAYRDATGHLTSGASLEVGHALGEYYAK